MSVRPRLAVAAALVVVATAACGPSTSPSPGATATPAPTSSASPSTPASPSPTSTGSATPGPSGDAANDAVYASIEEAVIRIRELDPKEDVDPQLLTEEELKERTERSFREDNPEELIEGNEILYRALGMLGEDDSLTDLYVELLGSQVAGFYDPEAKELFVVARSGGLGVSERVTYAHEFTHALQDQYFGLGDFGLDEIGEGDRNAARLSLVEGDATAVMAFWAQTALTPEEALKLLQESQDPEAQAILARMPPILRESLTFPYETGFQFVLRLQGTGGWDAVNAAFDDPPASTEQVLHPEKYDAREAPLEVDLPDDLAQRMGEGWSVPYEDTFGEFQFQVWLRNAIDAATGNPAAAGWGGDRFAALKGPNGMWALAMSTRWDSDAEAAEFEAAATQAIEDAAGSAQVLPGEGGPVRWVLIGSDEGVLANLADVLGVAG